MSDPQPPLDSAPHLDPHQHIPLSSATQQIRLLKVTRPDAHSRDAPITYALEIHKLDNTPQYHALSYVWGPPTPSFDITLDGQRFTIRKNLRQFLARLEDGCITSGQQLLLQEYANQCLGSLEMDEDELPGEAVEFFRPYFQFAIERYELGESVEEFVDGGGGVKPLLEVVSHLLKDRSIVQDFFEGGLYLWIDQLCIDQENVSERNQQVQLMGRIYSGARSVLAWLGEHLHQSDDMDVAPSSAHVDDATLAEGVRKRLAMLRSSYWSRVWVLQEFRLAQRLSLHMGDFCIPIIDKDMRGSGFFDKDMEDWIMPAHSRLTVFMGSARQNVQEWMYDLCASSRLDCTVPHDRVYGLLGLWQGMAGFPVDYEKPAAEVFWEAVGQCGDVIQGDRDEDGEFPTGIDRFFAQVGYMMGVTGRETMVQRPGVKRACELLWSGQALEKVFSTEHEVIGDRVKVKRGIQRLLQSLDPVSLVVSGEEESSCEPKSTSRQAPTCQDVAIQ